MEGENRSWPQGRRFRQETRMAHHRRLQRTAFLPSRRPQRSENYCICTRSIPLRAWYQNQQRVGYPSKHLCLQERSQSQCKSVRRTQQRCELVGHLLERRETYLSLHQDIAWGYPTGQSSTELQRMRLQSSWIGKHLGSPRRTQRIWLQSSDRYYQRGPNQEHAAQRQTTEPRESSRENRGYRESC